LSDARPDLRPLARAVAGALFRATDPEEFRPEEDWHDLGMLIEALEIRGFCLLLNSAFRDGRIRRIASFHKETEQGFPCAGSSEWGFFDRVGEAVLRAAHEALTKPRTT
jgi:hypothetical protein